MKYEIISIGFDGNPRRIGQPYNDKIVAMIVCGEYRADYPRIPFEVREAIDTQ